MARIELTDVVKRFGDLEVIKQLQLTVADGEFVVLLGPSGCGKTTTLRAIAGLETIDSGEIRIDGRPVHALPARERDIAFVFQLFALYPHLSAYDNVAFPLRAAGVSKREIDERVRAVAAILRIEPLLGSMPSALSGGDMQRVSMARALVRDPKAMLMDEPMGTLDATLREELRAELKHLHIETGSTTVYVTHDQIEAMSMGDRIAVMDAGVLQQIGPPKEVYDRPRTTFVAQFIGSPVMNILDGRLEVDGGAGRLTLGLEHPDRFEVRGDLARRAATSGTSGRPLLVGVRPEGVRVAREPVDGHVKATVESIEPLGPYDIVDVRVGDGLLRGNTRSRFIEREGEAVWVGLDESRVHLFDPVTGRAIESGRA